MKREPKFGLLLVGVGLVLAGCSQSASAPEIRESAPDAGSPAPTVDAATGGGPDGSVAGAAGQGAAGQSEAAGQGGAPVATVPPEIDGQVTINEVMASNKLTITDETGNAGDWIELFNPTATDIPLGGYGLTTALDTPAMATLPAGLVLPAGGHLVIWFDLRASVGPAHVALSLDKAGGAIGLSRPDGSYIDRVAFGAQEVDFSAAREPDGSNLWVIEWHASPGAANPAGAGQPVAADDPTQPPEAIPAAGDLSERILGYDVIPSFALTVGSDQWASLQADPDTYVPVTLTFDGRDYGPVGLHLKGMQSFEPIDQKPSLHVNIDKFVDGASFFGLKDITLNNMHSDPSMMHERIAYWVARQVGGVPASRANHAMVTINGQPYGLYANIETVKKRILSRWFTDDSGPLFSATDVDFTAADIPMFELVTGPDDRTALSGVAAAMTLATPDDQIAAAAQYVDLAELTRFWAFCGIVGQFDSFPYSEPGDDYFAYADPTSQRLSFMPWGMDETFLSGDLDIVKRMYAPLANACMASAGCFQSYVNQVWDILQKVEALDWTAEHDRVAAQIAPYIAMDTKRHHTDADVAQGQSDMRFFVSERRTHISTMIPPAASP
ncbi:MAG TPA: CotH kinase family protein [Polyangia bacterium]|nr:CotH kinase family protein [Polyangia bacterium]